MTLFITYGWPTIILCLLIITARSNVAAIIPPVLKCTAWLVFLVFSKSGFFLDVFPALEDSEFAGNLTFLEILP